MTTLVMAVAQHKGQKTRDNEEQILDNLIFLPAVSIINNFLLFRFIKQIMHVVYNISHFG